MRWRFIKNGEEVAMCKARASERGGVFTVHRTRERKYATQQMAAYPQFWGFMSILITGVTGFVGDHLLEYTAGQTERIYGIGHIAVDTSYAHYKHFQLFTTDLRDDLGINSVVRKAQPDIVYHLAGVASVKKFDADITASFEINTNGSLHLFEAVRQHSPKSKIVFISSGEVYGEVDKKNLPVTEETSIAPTNLYGVSKASAELLALNYWKNYGVDITILRPFNHIGPGQSTDFVTASFAKQIAQIKKNKKEPVLEVGNDEVKRDFTDVRDIVRAYDLAAKKCGGGEVYNVSSGTLYTISEILDKMIALAQIKVEIKESADRVRKHDIDYVWGSPKKFMSKTGWKPRYKIEDTLRDLLAYWMERT